MWESRVLQRAFERLELHEGKLSRAVLRGGGGGDVTSLPDTWVGNHPGLPGPEFPRRMFPEINPVPQPIELILAGFPFVNADFSKEEFPGIFRSSAGFGTVVSQNNPRKSFHADCPHVGRMHCQ